MKFYMSSLSLFMEVVNTVKPGRLLGLKVGTKYVGVAVSDTNYELASPYCVMEKKDNNIGEIASELKSLAMDVNKFRYDLDNTKILKGVKCACWEEGFASEQAACVMHPFKFDAEKEPQILHKLAATGMLQAYLDAVNRAKKDRETKHMPSENIW
ncbi:hypothetical protein CTI12_AA388270 [Artemisia annua]|uniref:Uncharacterized protein n=1 Tax=Artemisia annua TaxID=35608 RepID=A0A2U1MEW4_ARTAN|nr:hypothetical protein CTI12_AA388270 [Artemisia annua]